MVASPLVNVLSLYIHHVTKREGEAHAHSQNFLCLLPVSCIRVILFRHLGDRALVASLLFLLHRGQKNTTGFHMASCPMDRVPRVMSELIVIHGPVPILWPCQNMGWGSTCRCKWCNHAFALP